jgi:hypothetical protein
VQGRIPAAHHPVIRGRGVFFLDSTYRLHFYERDK